MPQFRKHAPQPGEPPNGICECGCGQTVSKLATFTRPEVRYWASYPVPYLPGHRPNAPRKHKGIPRPDLAYQPSPDEIPSGTCECGCGLPTLITNYTHRKTRHFKGYPSPYLQGHTPGRFKSGADSHRWRGGRIIRRGYVLIHMPDHPAADTKGYVPEHRIVMEHQIGRHLESFEHVHHINGDGTDNRPENLVVLTINEHMALHGSKTFRDYHASHPGKQSEAGRKGAAARWSKPS